MSDDQKNSDRREFMTSVTSGVGVAGVAIAIVPFAASLSPSERAIAAGAPVEVDISQLQEGEMKTVEWRGKPVWIVKRTPEMLASLDALDDIVADPDSVEKQQPEYVVNKHRSRKPEILVLVGICTHLGCSPSKKLGKGSLNPEWQGGFYCPCHGSYFDLAGRVFKGVPAPRNLEVPPHAFIDDDHLIIGLDKIEETV